MASSLVTVSVCSLNQFAMDFEHNERLIRQSILESRKLGASYRLGPELEITGYGCGDFFFENDTLLHAWEVMAKLLRDRVAEGMICDIGMPVMHQNVRYNCRVLISDNKILLIRPKMCMAMGGNYRESRWFIPWMRRGESEETILPPFIQSIAGQVHVPFGDCVLQTRDTCIGSETCEELFTPESPHIGMALGGVEIISNGSASHHELRKLHYRVDLLRSATAKCGGVYLYANCKGCDGERVYYDGCCLIAVNGSVVAQGRQFCVTECEVISAIVDLDAVRSYRGSQISAGVQAASLHTHSKQLPRVHHDQFLGLCSSLFLPFPTRPIEPFFHSAPAEISMGPALWLWDYLRRSRLSGFFLPLSGGVDSCATACIVFHMCRMVCDAIKSGNETALSDVQTITGLPEYVPSSPQDLCSHLLFTAYMATENSGEATRERARQLAQTLGARHHSVVIDTAVSAIVSVITAATGIVPKFKALGGTSDAENLALQNVQARCRMVVAYLFAQLVNSRTTSRSLLVLGSANMDESLCGYLTKYDCSSADLNPIGGLSKSDLFAFIEHTAQVLKFPLLDEFLAAPPTAELEPTTDEHVQTDEEDMGMTYQELSLFGRLRKIERMGPYSMFVSLCSRWRDSLSPSVIAEKVQHFFRRYAINRHKMTTLTPSYHAEAYGNDDNRFDLRPFLMNTRWPWQFNKINATVAQAAQPSEHTESHSAPPQPSCKRYRDQ